MKAYGAVYNNSIRLSSSSGGIFSALAAEFEVIYGVAMESNNLNAVFFRSEGDIEKLRGSKYIEARMGDTFKNVKKDLECGSKVLFTGTSCQVNGLITYLKIKYDNLTTVDIICHGVPSVKLWHTFIGNRNIDRVNFRAKNDSWQDYGLLINNKFIPRYANKYMKLYLTNNPLRPSCYECVCKQNKMADITIGDFWGVDKLSPRLDDKKGTSLVIVRSKKGEQLIEKISYNLNISEIDYDLAVKYNESEYKSAQRPKSRDIFMTDLITGMSFEELYKKYYVISPKKELTDRIIRYIKKIYRLFRKNNFIRL